VRLKWRSMVVNSNNESTGYYKMSLSSVRPRELAGDLAGTGMPRPRQYTRGIHATRWRARLCDRVWSPSSVAAVVVYSCYSCVVFPGPAAKGRLANGAGIAGTVPPLRQTQPSPQPPTLHPARRRRDANAARRSITLASTFRARSPPNRLRQCTRGGLIFSISLSVVCFFFRCSSYRFRWHESLTYFYLFVSHLAILLRRYP